MLYRNRPDRTPPNAIQLAVERAAALIEIAAPLAIPAGLVLDMHADVQCQRIAMHGGPGPGERFMRPKARTVPLPNIPKARRAPLYAPSPDAKPRPLPCVGRPDITVEVRSKATMSAVAGARVTRGLAEAAELAALRASAAQRQNGFGE